MALAMPPRTRAMSSARTLGGICLPPQGEVAKSARSTYISAVAGVDANDVACLDEERHLYGGTGFEFRGLGGVGGRVTFEAGIGFDNLELDVCRQVHADGRAVVKLHVDHHAVFQEVGRATDEIALQRDVLERLLIHEMKTVGIVVEHLHLAIVDGRALQLFTGAERPLERRTGLDVLEARPHERGAFARFDVQELDNSPEVAVHDDGNAVTEIVRRDHGWAVYGPTGGKPSLFFERRIGPSVPARMRAMFSR